MAANFQADLVPGPPSPASTGQDHRGDRADWEPRSFAKIDEQDDGLLIRALALHATHGDHEQALDQLERGRGRETRDRIASFLSMARNIVLNPADVDLLREACVARGGEIRIAGEADFEVNFARTASAVHLTQLGYFEALPSEGWRLKPGLKAKVKAALKVESA